MTDVDTLRRALRVTPDSHAFAHDDLDVAGILRRGRRVRARRRLILAGAAACVAAMVFGLVTGTGLTASPAVPPVVSGRSAPAHMPGGTTPRPSSRPARTPMPARFATPSAKAVPAPTASPTARTTSSPTPAITDPAATP